MDPMDYTMDEAGNQMNPGNNPAARYQCQQQPALPSVQHGYSSQGRDSSQFDPVHDASNYYYGLNGNAPARPSYTTPQHQHMQSWGGVPSYMPGSGWQGFGDMSRPNTTQGGTDSLLTHRGPGRNYEDMSWGGYRPYGRLEDTYGPFSNQLNGHNLPSDNGMGPGGIGQGGSTGQPSALRPSPFAQNFDRPPMDLFPGQSGPSHSHVPSVGAGHTRQQMQSQSFPAPLGTGSSRYQRAPRASISRSGMHGSTAADRLSWGDSDEDSVSDHDNEAVRREVAFYREGEEEHAVMIQSAIAAGRKHRAKEAFQSLEKLKVEDLPKESKDCTICYNDFGVENPDGVVEQPVRWPKCKHLFGDKCIQRWFEEGKDTCPYCREKIPSANVGKRSDMEAQMRMMQRRRMLQLQAAVAAQQRPRQGGPPASANAPEDFISERTPLTPQFSRSQDDYDVMVNHNADHWTYSSHHRYSPGDSPERRRQGRGRPTGGRTAHPMARPISIGSARSVSQSFNFSNNPPPRSFGPSLPSLHTPTSTRRTFTPGMPRLAQPQTPQARASASLPGSSSASPEEASPPVAVGSGVPAVVARHWFGADNIPGSSRDPGMTAGANRQHQHQRIWNEDSVIEQRINASIQRAQSSNEHRSFGLLPDPSPALASSRDSSSSPDAVQSPANS
ncbi:hypothetical protein VTL71DRAFT_4254 [Oculimacula yallundae]|uniref:RING-type domain-containing protein n=1 Tax=Oculimacula yallundae TaxID=86028 RepID=A0ABR4C5B8_9HELO